MTPRLAAARLAVAHLVARYLPLPHQGNARLSAAIAELEEAARVEDDKPSDPPVTLDPLAAAVAREGIDVVSPQTLPPAPPEPPAEASPLDLPPPQLPSVSEAVADALAPHDSTPEKGAQDVKQPKSRTKTK